MPIGVMVHAWQGRDARERVEPGMAVLMNVARLPAAEARGVLDRSPDLAVWRPRIEKDTGAVAFGPVATQECEEIVHQMLTHPNWAEQVTLTLNGMPLSDWLIEDQDRLAGYRAHHGLYDAVPASTCDRVDDPVFRIVPVE